MQAEQRFEPGLQGNVLALNWQVQVLKNRHFGKILCIWKILKS